MSAPTETPLTKVRAYADELRAEAREIRSSRMTKEQSMLAAAFGVVADKLVELVESAPTPQSEGYKVTNLGGENVWVHGGGRDGCTAWVETFDGRPMLCVGDENGEDARPLPCAVAYALSMETESPS